MKGIPTIILLFTVFISYSQQDHYSAPVFPAKTGMTVINKKPAPVIEKKAEDEDIIEWDENRKLSWDDYKKPLQFDDLNAHHFHAASTTMIRLGNNINCFKNDSIEVEVKAIFSKSRSWAALDEINDDILRHEQYHFHFTEAYARKIKEEISKIKCTKINEETGKALVSEIWKKHYKEYDLMQKKYDQETNHGINKMTQAQWEKKIDDLLKALEAFKN